VHEAIGGEIGFARGNHLQADRQRVLRARIDGVQTGFA